MIAKAPEMDLGDTNLSPDRESIGKTFDLFSTPQSLVEVRSKARHWASRCFSHDERDQFVAYVLELPTDTKGVYATLNPVDPSHPRTKAVEDRNINGRNWLLIDFDPKRPADTNATEREKAAAIELAHWVAAWISEALGWPSPVIADSGNGRHLLYRVDLPADEPARRLMKELLDQLREYFATDCVTIDTTVHNASRITRLYGTVNRKGPDLPERPQRVSALRHVPQCVHGRPIHFKQLESAVATLREIAGGQPRSDGANSAATNSGGWLPSLAEMRRRAGAWLRKKDASIQGQHGSQQLKSAAIEMMVGFALPQGDARQLLLSEFNPRCVPPWPESEIDHALETTAAKELNERAGQVGWRYRQSRPRGGGGNSGGADPKCEPRTDRPEVLVTTDEFRTNAAALAAIAQGDDGLYQRAGVLVHVVEEKELTPKAGTKEIRRAAGALRIARIDEHNLRERLTRHARFVKPDTRKNAEPDAVVATHPPVWCVKGILARGQWDQIRPLSGIATCPVLRRDGSVILKSGYDPESGIILESGETCSVPESPTRDELAAAVRQLTDLVEDFPFAGPEHRSGWIALVLTLLARHAIDGPCPLFLIDANSRGSGKSLLADLAGMIALGQEFPRMTAPDKDSETVKKITSIALAGDAAVLLDNISPQNGLGTPSLDAAITGKTWRDRMLTTNTMVQTELNTVWCATGNNVSLKGDMLRRVQHIRLESLDEQPELRSDFRWPRILDYARENRMRLVEACLTILRAFLAAGRPSQKLPPWGSFEEWSDLIRQAIVFAGLPDPGVTRDDLRENADTGEKRFAALMSVWDTIDPEGTGVTTGQIIKTMGSGAGKACHLPEIVVDFVDSVHPVPAHGLLSMSLSSVTLGKALKQFRGCVAAGRRLECRDRRKQAFWQAVPVRPASSDA